MSDAAGEDDVATVEAFRAAQNAGDVEACLRMLAPDALVDIGSGRFEGARRITTLLRLLARIHYTTSGDPARRGEDGLLTAVWTVRHDDLRRNGLGELVVSAEIRVVAGAIHLLRTRATPETLERLRARSGGGEGYGEDEPLGREP